MPKDRLDRIVESLVESQYGEDGPATPIRIRKRVDDDDVEMKPVYTQYIRDGNIFRPAGPIRLVEKLQPYAYNIISDMSGLRFVKVKPRTDELYRFKSSVMEAVLSEINHFWGLKPNFDKLGLIHHRGLMVYGPPGSGKSALMQQVAENMIARGDVIFFSRGIGSLEDGLKAFREVEPDRKVVVVLEDMDEYIQYSERDMLQLFDGENTVDNVLYCATTNYIDKFPPRLLRPGRFDKKVHLGMPPVEGRLIYLQKKLGTVETPERIQELAEQTDGFSFGHLRELVISGYAFKDPIEQVITRLRGTNVRGLPKRAGEMVVSEGRVRYVRRKIHG